MRTEQQKRESRESATRKLLRIGGKARGKHAPRSHEPRGNMVGSIHPDLALQRAAIRERNAELRLLGLPIPVVAREERIGCSNLALIVVTLRAPKPLWIPAEHEHTQFPPLSQRSAWRAPSDPNSYVPAMLADCKRFGLILSRPSDPSLREIRGTGIAIEAMLRISPDWCAKWQYVVDAGSARGISQGSGPIGVGAKRRIAEGKREAIAKAEDREISRERDLVRSASDRALVSAYLATFGISDPSLTVQWEREIMGKRDIPLLDSEGKQATDTFGNSLLRKDNSGNVMQEWYTVKTVTDSTSAEDIAVRMISAEQTLQNLAAIADDTDAIQAARDGANNRLTSLIGEFKVWQTRLEQAAR